MGGRYSGWYCRPLQDFLHGIPAPSPSTPAARHLDHLVYSRRPLSHVAAPTIALAHEARDEHSHYSRSALIGCPFNARDCSLSGQ